MPYSLPLENRLGTNVGVAVYPSPKTRVQTHVNVSWIMKWLCQRLANTLRIALEILTH